jgi:predicted phosphodiesterase
VKIGILSDIHGNDIALKAMLKEAEFLGVEQLYVLGDCVGYYYRPDKVMELLSAWPMEMIQGNHEGMLSRIRHDKSEEKRIGRRYGSGLRIALEKLTDAQISEFCSLPPSKLISANSLKIHLAHGSPWDRDYYIYPDKVAREQEKFKSIDSDYFFLGHTHYSFVFTRDEQTIVNVGSIGQARDRGGLASWACFDTENRSIVFKHTPFDPVPLIEEVKQTDPELPYLHQILVRGR